MESLDRLRRCFDNFAILNTETAKKVVNDLADEIEKELGERYVELPLDKDGVPIHVGDEMVDTYGHEFVVRELDFRKTIVRVYGIAYGIGHLYEPSQTIHRHEPTAEEVIGELIHDVCHMHESSKTHDQLVKEYAKRLQIREG